MEEVFSNEARGTNDHAANTVVSMFLISSEILFKFLDNFNEEFIVFNIAFLISNLSLSFLSCLLNFSFVNGLLLAD